jgi:hypothetical protein
MQIEETATTNGAIETAPKRRKRRKRRGKKRLVFKDPVRTAPAVRELWRQASEEEKAKAHSLCVSVLEYWLGRTSKQDLSKRLGIPPLRVWQLSQQALSGMLAGLLKQPRGRGTREMAAIPPEDDPRVLRKRIKELERQLKQTEELVMILRDLPANRPAPAAAVPLKPVEGSASRETKKTPAREKKTDRASAPRDQATDRGASLGRGSSTSAG